MSVLVDRCVRKRNVRVHMYLNFHQLTHSASQHPNHRSPMSPQSHSFLTGRLGSRNLGVHACTHCHTKEKVSIQYFHFGLV
jgi:hypothetical protein